MGRLVSKVFWPQVVNIYQIVGATPDAGEIEDAFLKAYRIRRAMLLSYIHTSRALVRHSINFGDMPGAYSAMAYYQYIRAELAALRKLKAQFDGTVLPS